MMSLGRQGAPQSKGTDSGARGATPPRSTPGCGRRWPARRMWDVPAGMFGGGGRGRCRGGRSAGVGWSGWYQQEAPSFSPWALLNAARAAAAAAAAPGPHRRELAVGAPRSGGHSFASPPSAAARARWGRGLVSRDAAWQASTVMICQMAPRTAKQGRTRKFLKAGGEWPSHLPSPGDTTWVE